VTDRPELVALLSDPASVPTADIAAAIGELEKAKATLWARLTAQAPNRSSRQPEPPYTLVDAAALLLKSPVWLRRRAKAGVIPGARKYGKAWVFDRELFDRFRARREVG
jgi:hypothetical protein